MENNITVSDLFKDISQLIDSARVRVAHYANSSLVLLYWKIGSIVESEILKEDRAEYGLMIVKQLSVLLTSCYGRGFNRSALFRMVRFFKYFPDEQIVATLSRLLSWSHFVELISLDDTLKQQFYTELCHLERWSVRELRKKIDSMLYERTAISHKPEKFIKQELKELKENKSFSEELVFKDPYILDFLKLPANYTETNLENAILDELSRFLHELGTDFSFIARQKRIIIDNEDYYIDLLTFHRGLRRLVAIELKLGKFTASHKGQMELYLRWLNKYERRDGEGEPLGLILCAEKSHEHIELLELDKSGIHVAQYLTQLPSREVLEQKLKMAIAVAKEKQARMHLTQNQVEEVMA